MKIKISSHIVTNLLIFVFLQFQPIKSHCIIKPLTQLESRFYYRWIEFKISTKLDQNYNINFELKF